MTKANAIKKLEKNGFKVEADKYTSNKFHATKEGFRRFLSFYIQDDSVIIVDLRTPGYEDDSMTDYHAGTFLDNISQGIRAVLTW